MTHYKCTENILSIILLDYSINFEYLNTKLSVIILKISTKPKF